MKGVFSAPGDYIYFKSQVPLHKIPVRFSLLSLSLNVFPPFHPISVMGFDSLGSFWGWIWYTWVLIGVAISNLGVLLISMSFACQVVKNFSISAFKLGAFACQ